MTALERAKAFINTRAAKTALRIMPLAVAAVAVVGITPNAHATSATFTANQAFFSTGTCSGVACIDFTNTSSGYGPTADGYGAVGTGSSHMTIGKPGWLPDANGISTYDAFFTVSGTANGTFPGDDLKISWDFSANCGPSPCSVNNPFSYNVFFNLDQDPNAPYTYSGSYIPVTGPVAQTWTIPGYSTSGPMSGPLTLTNANWTATIDLNWITHTDPTVPPTADQADWCGTSGTSTACPTLGDFHLSVDPGSPAPSGVPEPASMLLALAGLPLIGGMIRKKR